MMTLRRTLARLVLDEHLKMPGFVQNFPGDPARQPGPLFGTESVAGFRANKQFFLDQWLVVANDYLEKHPAPPNGPEVRWVIGPVGWVLNSYSDGDDWPAEKTAALLTEQLRGYYTDDPNKTTDVKSLYDLVPAEPATLLAEIVPITGAIPDFVRKGHPKLASVAARLKRLGAVLKAGQPSPRALTQGPAEFAGLMGQAPYEVIKLAVGQRPAYPSASDRKADIWNPWYVLQATSAEQPELWNNNRRTDIDPRLLLTVLADLAGQNQVQDNRIAGLLSNPNMKDRFRVPMENLLTSPLKARGTARRLLEKIAATAKSPELVKVIRDLDPILAPPKS
jgi:hypothetical protein